MNCWAILLPRYVEMSIYRAMLESTVGVSCGAYGRHGCGEFECGRRDPNFDAELEPRPSGEHYARNY